MMRTCWAYQEGIMENKMETVIVYWGYIEISYLEVVSRQ